MKGTLLTLLLFFVSFVRAQDIRDHWILSDSMHLQFTDSGLVFLGVVPFQSEESIATISDLDGNLLLFANESRVYDQYYNIIGNGDSLFASSYATTSTQGAVLLPNNGNYYIINRIYDNQPNGSLSYSIIKFDSMLNNFYIPSVSKKIVVHDEQFAEQLQVVRHGNGVDWWIIGRKLINTYQPISNAFIVYKLSGEDFTLEHEIEIGEEAHFQGELAASPDGSLIALASLSIGVLQLFDFDRCTGVVSNPRVLIDDPSATYYGCAFSPDGTKLYVAKKNSEVLEQIDLTAPDFPVTRIFSANFGTNHGAGQLELGPDNRLYWIQYAHGLILDSLPAMYLGVINEPNMPGLSCNFNPYGVWLGGRINRFSLGLPNHPNYYLGPLVGSPCDTLSNPDTTTAVQPILVPLNSQCFALKVDQVAYFFQIEPTQQFSNAAVEVYNSSGTLQTSATITNTSLRVSTHDWPAGLYVVSVRTPEASCLSQKFVVGRP